MAAITARIIADSICPSCPVTESRPEPVRLTTWLVEAPRYILAEINTHRALCRNAASSRAIPVDKRAEQVLNDPAMPAWWCQNQRGMQSKTSLPPEKREAAEAAWRRAAAASVEACKELAEIGCHKQISNRPSEPFAAYRGLITATEVANFFHLRVAEPADPTFDLLAYRMLQARETSVPRELKPGEWHVPFGEQMYPGLDTNTQLEVSAARCARLSFENHLGKFDLADDLRLAREVLWKPEGDDPPDASPFEHQAQAVGEFAWPRTLEAMARYLKREDALFDGEDILWGPFRWWRQWRKQRPNNTRRTLDAKRLLAAAEQRWAERGIPL